MPYQPGNRLPAERASKLGHLDVLKSDLVNKFCESFVSLDTNQNDDQTIWTTMPQKGKILPIIFGVDGSLQALTDDKPPYKSLAFVKTALLRLDQNALSKIDKESPHPFALRDIMADSALYHATVFPLRNVSVPGLTIYDAIRQGIYESLKDASLQGELFETLKWIAYEKWDNLPKQLKLFECPHCHRVEATLRYDEEEGRCPICKKHIFLTDMLGFHQEMSEDSAPDSIASSYMAINETLLLFTGIRFFWENNKGVLANALFIKDGPLSIRAQYSKLVAPIRRFLSYAKGKGSTVHILGQEKTGRFFDYLQIIGNTAPVGTYFIPDDHYIKLKIQNRSDDGADYGNYTNYGVKVFVKYSNYHQMVLNIPTGNFIKNAKYEDLIGGDNILATLPTILGNRYEGALLPIELANGVASLSTYPSARILKIFSESFR